MPYNTVLSKVKCISKSLKMNVCLQNQISRTKTSGALHIMIQRTVKPWTQSTILWTITLETGKRVTRWLNTQDKHRTEMKCKIFFFNFSLKQLGSSIMSTMSLLGISSEYYYRNKYNIYQLLAAKKSSSEKRLSYKH